MKRFLVVTLMVVSTAVALAGGPARERGILPRIADVAPPPAPLVRELPRDANLESSAITWMVLDSMANAYGPASTDLKPMVYDPTLNVVGVIHRAHLAYGAASGELWYNLSRDGGNTWRRVTSLNVGIELDTRYPSCAIFNPTGGTDTANAFFIWAAPLLATGGAGFGRVAYGLDVLGSGAGIALQEAGANDFWSSLLVWGAGPWAHWNCYRGTSSANNDFFYWRTQDYGTILSGVPSTWASTNWVASDFHLDIGSAYRNGASYFGAWGVFSGEPGEVDNFGYCKSTDNGQTWSAWTRPTPDWRSVPGLGMQYDWWAFGTIGGGLDLQMLVDANGRTHFFGVINDTLSLERTLVEIYETGSGWNSKVIQADIKESVNLTYGAVNQMGHHLQTSISEDGTVMSIVWLDAASQGETMPDIWGSHRHIDGGWSTPENLTQTPTVAELLLHAAPILKNNGGGNYSMFLGRTYQIGTGAYPPDDTQPCYFYVGNTSFTQLPASAEETPGIPLRFGLEQNYPNPFNPTTMIGYSIDKRAHVRVTVFDVLGREVMQLVDGEKEAGRYDVSVSASELSSGVYLYTLTAGGLTETRKFVVLK